MVVFATLGLIITATSHSIAALAAANVSSIVCLFALSSTLFFADNECIRSSPVSDLAASSIAATLSLLMCLLFATELSRTRLHRRPT